jgi:ABC-2 type transport system ATP-binding protein
MGVYRGLQSYAVEAEDLKKTFKTSVGRALLRKQTVIVNAVDGLTLRIGRGQIHSLVGPKGAGKTTTIKILSTLLIPDSGRALVGGFDVVKEPEKVREIIGLVLAPDKGFYTRLTGLENLVYYGRLYGLSRGEAIRRARELLELVGLADEGKRLYEEYSLGMKAKLSIAKAMINDPSIIFFDEPTIGLDPLSARRVRQVIRDLATQGRTILLTSHNMWEVENLSNKVSLIKGGKIVVEGSPADLKERLRLNYRIEVELLDSPAAAAIFQTQVGERGYPVITLETSQPSEDLVRLLEQLRSDGCRVGYVRVHEPSLEEVFEKVVTS